MPRVGVIGQTVVREIFQGANRIGETIRIANANFKIKGLLPAKGTGPMGTDIVAVMLMSVRERVREIGSRRALPY
jgi:hypothetical protein